MIKIKKFNEMASYNETMTIEDLIYVMEQQDPNNFIVQHNLSKWNQNRDGENLFIISEFVKLKSKGMEMKNKGYLTGFDGDKFNFYTYVIESNPRKLLGTIYGGNITNRENLVVDLPEHKTIGELIELAKQIPNPSKSLFFIEGESVGYEKTEKHYSFEAPMGLGNYNMKTYLLSKGGKVVSGNILTANSFMGESKGRYELRSKFA